jgi:flagellar biosynthesis GTPase FlhF
MNDVTHTRIGHVEVSIIDTSTTTTTTAAIELAPSVRELNASLSSLATLKLALESITSTIADLTPILDEARTLTITSASTYQAADLFLFKVRQARKRVEPLLAPIKTPLNAAKTTLMGLEHKLDDPLAEAEKTVKATMARWQIQEEKRRGDEERKRQEEIRKRQQEESRLAAEADRKRREEAQAAYQAQQAKTAKERREAQERADTARRETQRLEEQQRLAAAETDRAAAVRVEGPVKAAGSTVRIISTWEVADFHVLVQAVARGEVPECWLMPNEDVIEECFKQDQAITCAKPGLKHVAKTSVAGR